MRVSDGASGWIRRLSWPANPNGYDQLLEWWRPLSFLSRATTSQVVSGDKKVSGLGLGGLEGHRQVLDAVDEVGAETLDLAVELHVGRAAQELLEHHPDLEAGQV